MKVKILKTGVIDYAVVTKSTSEGWLYLIGMAWYQESDLIVCQHSIS